jgi:hypothetical protein
MGQGNTAVSSLPLRPRHPGQAVFEFTIVLWIFVAVFLLAVDFAVWMSAHVSAQNAAREGARFAAMACGGVGCTDGSAIQNRVKERGGYIVDNVNEVQVWWVDRNSSAPAAPNTTKPGRGDSFLVRVTHPHSFLFVPYFPNSPFPPINIVACAEMVIEADDLAYQHLAGQDTNSVAVTPGDCP